MSADHKRPLLAFVLVTIACLLIVVNAARSQAVRSALHHGAERVEAGVRLALEDDPAPVAATAPRSFDRDDDERADRARRRAAATVLPPAPQVALPSTLAASVGAPERIARAPRPQAVTRHGVAISRTQVSHSAHRAHRLKRAHRVHRVHRAGDHRAAAAKHTASKAAHGSRVVERAAHRTASGLGRREPAVSRSLDRLAQHPSPARTTSGHRASSRPHHAASRPHHARGGAHHRSHHSHHGGGRHHRR